MHYPFGHNLSNEPESKKCGSEKRSESFEVWKKYELILLEESSWRAQEGTSLGANEWPCLITRKEWETLVLQSQGTEVSQQPEWACNKIFPTQPLDTSPAQPAIWFQSCKALRKGTSQAALHVDFNPQNSAIIGGHSFKVLNLW